MTSIVYRGVFQDENTSVAMTIDDSNGLYTGSIPNDAFGNQGMGFVVFTRNDNGDETVSAFQFASLTVAGRATNIRPNIGFGSTITNYKILAVPFTNAPITDVLDELADVDYRFDWRMFEYTTYFQDKSSGNFEAGKGYMLLVKTGTDISIDVGNTVRATNNEPFALPLGADWTLIGNPFTRSINWAEVLAFNEVAGNIYEGDVSGIYTYNGSYSEGNGNLDVFQGAFVRTSNGAVSDFVIPVEAAEGGRYHENKKTGDSYFQNSQDWKLKLNLSGGVYQYTLSGVGMSPTSNVGFDKKDLWTPPRFIDYLEANFEIFGRTVKFSQNIVNPTDEYVWEMQLNTNLNENITISWDKAVLGGLSGYLLLRDLETGEVVNMKSTSQLLVRNADGKDFEVIHTQNISDEIANVLQLLGKSYPNPFVDETSIPIEIVGDQSKYLVNLDILSLKGKIVRQLIDDQMDTGNHIINWNGEDTNGISLPNGIYLYRLNYDGRDIPFRKLILQK